MRQDALSRNVLRRRGWEKVQALIPRRVSRWRDALRRAASFFTESAGKCKCAGHLATMAVVCGPYFKGWFFGRGREGGSARVAARGGRRERWRALPAMQSSQKYSSSSSGNPHDRPRLYTGSPNPLIRVDSHDRLEGYPPTSPPLLIHPPSLRDHPQLTHSQRRPRRGAPGPHSDSQHAWLTISGLKMTVFLYLFCPRFSPLCSYSRLIIISARRSTFAH